MHFQGFVVNIPGNARFGLKFQHGAGMYRAMDLAVDDDMVGHAPRPSTLAVAEITSRTRRAGAHAHVADHFTIDAQAIGEQHIAFNAAAFAIRAF